MAEAVAAEALTQAEAVAAEAHRTFIRITQADKRREGRRERDGQWNGCAVEAAGNQLSKKGQQNANVNDR